MIEPGVLNPKRLCHGIEMHRNNLSSAFLLTIQYSNLMFYLAHQLVG